MTSALAVLGALFAIAAGIHGYLRFAHQREAVRAWLAKKSPTGGKQRLDDNF